MSALNRPLLLVLPALIAALACEPLVTTFDDIEGVTYYRASSIQPTEAADSLVVVTWNIKYGGGGLDFWFDCWGERVLMTEKEVTENLDRVAAHIVQLDPDVLLLNEVEVSSRRSAYVDQVQYLLDATGLNYGVYASLWKSQFIPSDGIGRMNMGNAILSKYELSDGERIALKLRSDQDALTQYFYLHRNILTAKVAAGTNSDLYAVVIHTAAFSQDGTKQDHIDRFKEELDRFAAAGALFVGGGDLNTIPPNAETRIDFGDSKCTGDEFQADDYTNEADWLRPLYRDYFPAIDTLTYGADESAYFSHTTNSYGPFSRKVDYLFTNMGGGWVAGSGQGYNLAMGTGRERLSDHASVSAVIVVSGK
ncbi:MAG: endonuclease/exonuclease/phosphatase family protein [Candidatus Marinimicrobia bacterium]|nr:endonuclease/exonuclease/phosphatase family protein [Candidatus Neomarinimicrobiota bacterium]